MNNGAPDQGKTSEDFDEFRDHTSGPELPPPIHEQYYDQRNHSLLPAKALGDVGKNGSCQGHSTNDPRPAQPLLKNHAAITQQALPVTSTPVALAPKHRSTPAGSRIAHASASPQTVVRLPGIPPFVKEQLPCIRKTGRLKDDGTYDGLMQANHYDSFLLITNEQPLPPLRVHATDKKKRVDAQNKECTWHKQRTKAMKELFTKDPQKRVRFFAFIKYCRENGVSGTVHLIIQASAPQIPAYQSTFPPPSVSQAPAMMCN